MSIRTCSFDVWDHIGRVIKKELVVVQPLEDATVQYLSNTYRKERNLVAKNH